MKKPDRFISLGWIALILGHFLAAIYSFGFHHPDEHFQILEWANYFVGNSPDGSHLPWEFAAQIRPWFQPLIHAFFIKVFMMMGIYEPFSAATFFRMAYAFLNLWTLFALWQHFQKKYQLSSKWFLILGTMWFFPYIHVRTSSENLSGILISFALIKLDQALDQTSDQKTPTNRLWWISGLLFGFGFLARYQIALGLVGVAFALLIRDRGIRQRHWALLGGFLIPVAIGTLLDRWGYGNWVFTPYQYYFVNIVQNVAATFNPYPWYQYFIWILQFIPFISIPFFYGVTRFSWKNKLDVFTTFFVMYFVLHWFITNKEYRFLFPILNFAPLMAMAWFQHSTSSKKFANRPIFVLYLGLSLIAFMGSSLRGAALKTLWPIHMIHQFTEKNPDAEWLTNQNYLQEGKYKRPYYNIALTKGFRPEAMHLYQDIPSLDDLRKKHPHSYILFDSKVDGPAKEIMFYLETSGCDLVFSPLTKWASERFRFDYQVVYHCKYTEKSR